MMSSRPPVLQQLSLDQAMAVATAYHEDGVHSISMEVGDTQILRKKGFLWLDPTGWLCVTQHVRASLDLHYRM